MYQPIQLQRISDPEAHDRLVEEQSLRDEDSLLDYFSFGERRIVPQADYLLAEKWISEQFSQIKPTWDGVSLE